MKLRERETAFESSESASAREKRGINCVSFPVPHQLLPEENHFPNTSSCDQVARSRRAASPLSVAGRQGACEQTQRPAVCWGAPFLPPFLIHDDPKQPNGRAQWRSRCPCAWAPIRRPFRSQKPSYNHDGPRNFLLFPKAHLTHGLSALKTNFQKIISEPRQ